MLKRFSSLLLGLLILGMVGCGKKADAPVQGSAPDQPTASKPARRVAVIPKGTAHVFWQTVYAGARAAGQKFGVEVLWKGPAKETEYTRQIEIIEDYLAQGVDAFVIAPTEQNALVPVVEKIAATGNR
jgi:ribose transport system substrate-binding protein